MTETKPFARADLAQAPTKLLRNGRVANAVVTRVEIDGRSWTVKDFSARPWWVRTFIAPFLLRRELSILARLRGVEGVSQESFRIDREAMAVLFMEGSNIGREPERVTPAYLEAFEELLRAMHARGVVLVLLFRKTDRQRAPEVNRNAAVLQTAVACHHDMARDPDIEQKHRVGALHVDRNLAGAVLDLRALEGFEKGFAHLEPEFVVSVFQPLEGNRIWLSHLH